MVLFFGLFSVVLTPWKFFCRRPWRQRGSFLLKLKNNPSLGRKTRCQIFKLRTNICY